MSIGSRIKQRRLVNVLTANLSAADIKTAIVTSDISFRITKERVNRRMTQKEFAEYMGVTQAMVSKWESGDYNFTIGSIAKIFEKLKLDFNFEITSDQEWSNINHSNISIASTLSPIALIPKDTENKLLCAG